MKRLCTICARGGSKGVPNKNILPIAGTPLIAYSILQAKQSGLFSYVAVSSDAPDILAVAKEYGADFLIERPLPMASDTAAKLPAIKHCAKTVIDKTKESFDVYCDLDATSPLRYVKDIAVAVGMAESHPGSNIITGTRSRRSPYFNLVEQNGEFVKLSKQPGTDVVRRQDAPICWDLNASIYVWTHQTFWDSDKVLNERTMLHEMPEERSIDIDSKLDLAVVSMLLQARDGKIL